MLTKLKYVKYYSGLLLNNWTTNKLSYSQHQEDILLESLLPKGVSSFIDVGANDGVLFSNTYKFAKLGSRGLCIEPSRSSFLKLTLNHLFHPKIKCIRVGISDHAGEMFLSESGYENVLSTISENICSNSYPVDIISMNDLLQRFPIFRKADLVSIDVEGLEDMVIKGAGDSLLQTKIIILETDKSNVCQILELSSLRNHYPGYCNDINLILLNKNHIFANPIKLPPGFYKC